MSEKFHHIGKSLPRVDAPGKVSGLTRFITDMHFDSMVFAYPVVSPIAFGALDGVDISPARKMPGFLGAWFAGDIPGENQVGVILPDQPLFAQDKLRFVGDAIGIVAAETEVDAISAARSVKIDTTPREPILSINASKMATGKKIHENNIACEHRLERGDIQAGFADADVVVEADLVTPYQEHFYLEPQGCIVVPQGDAFTVYGSIQCVFYVQKAIAKVLGISFSKVRVIQTPTGGAFGGKEDIPSEMCARAAVAAWHLQRPVKMIYRRRDDVQWTSKRHPFQMHYKVGVSKTGKLLSADIILEENAGAYATLSSVVSYRATMQAMGPYAIPNIQVHSTSYYTNLPPTGAFRGFGSPQATFGHERMMDILADRLGMDPVEFRLKNILKPGQETQTGHALSTSVGAEATLLKSANAAEWQTDARPMVSKDGRYREALGVSVCHYGNCLGAAGWSMDGAGVKIQINRDGSIAVAFGLIEMGQGALTVVTQMTAEALGVNAERISILPTDTSQVPDSGPSVASRNIVMTGNAIRNAVEKLKPILSTAAAEAMECAPENVAFQNDQVVNTKSGNALSISALCEYLYVTNRPMDALGWWHVPALTYDAQTGRGEAYFTYSYATHIARVQVDTLTGQVRVQKVWAAHDVGKIINPAGLAGQVQGGVVQGAGWAIYENFGHDNAGRITTPNLSTYLLPTAADSVDVQAFWIEDPEPLGPWGAKGIGEPAIIPTAAAIANAVSRIVGQPMNQIPLTPERVLVAFEDKVVHE
ncbi:MAG: xanthine dehydrogenase family protein molybdopterin-binding subunit [Lentisphaeria bacterium]|nr:xanthine dehydrogenase family protein molybdopterin-binding subunit [Candidatus Neomarinimicrobiota bacterium]MCF7841482.1 xanthine dehydrogenase family protein molybdopterin-binding subunit [Lentisphaeria bacterium]